MLQDLLKAVQRGEVTVEQAAERLQVLPYENLGFARIDHHRHLRRDFPEVIYCPGKTEEQIVAIFKRLAATGDTVLATRAEPQVFEAIKGEIPAARYYREAQAVVLHSEMAKQPVGMLAVVSAGTADLPVAEEAALTAELIGSRVERFYDVGVAGIHRLFDSWEIISKAKVIVVVAGMEGALASVVGGLANCPVIAVPTIAQGVGSSVLFYLSNYKSAAPYNPKAYFG